MGMQLLNSHFKLINAIWFQLVWFAAVLFQNWAVPALVASLLLHWYLSPKRRDDVILIALIAPIGMAADILIQASGLIVFKDGPFPLWLLMLWEHFAVVLNHGFAWLGRINPWLVGAMGAFSGASSYFAGAKFGAATLIEPVYVVAAHALMWATLLPLFLQIRKRVIRERLPALFFQG